MSDIEKVKKYYKNYDEDGRLLSKYGLVEYLTTMRYIEKYLKKGDRIIEIGAGTGRYSHALSRAGYVVDAVELVEENINIFRSNITPNEQISIVQGNALDLCDFADESYDIALLLGPLYHLYSFEEQKKAIAEALRVTKCGGVVFAAYVMADASVLTYGFKKNVIEEIVSDCELDTDTFDEFTKPWGVFELYRKENIDKLRREFDVEHLNFIITDGYANHMREEIEKMDERTFDLFIKYHFSICEREDMVGLSHHTLDVFRKRM
ncbi:MAG: class I SAM-dependent methyltransferase [Ruminococcus sp.]|nr:class I SAM-dependent methyltransferase [Ruminococcus sp.]